MARMTELPTLSAVRIDADRVVLRKARDTDRERLIELQTDARVWAYLGGPRERAQVEQGLEEIGGAANVTARPGVFVVADRATDALLGTVEVKRAAADMPVHVTGGGRELELGYLMRPDAWGCGLAFEATGAALRATAEELGDQPVILVTQSANKRSLNLAARLGFRPFATFEQFGAEQTLAVAGLHTFKA